MHSLLASIRNRLRVWRLQWRALVVESSVANAEADMLNTAAKLAEDTEEYQKRMKVLARLRLELDTRQSSEVILKHITKGN